MRLPSIAASLVALAVVFLNAQPVMAAGRFFSATGSGSTCSQAAPCSFFIAVSNSSAGEEVSCADNSDNGPAEITQSVTVDCAGTSGSIGGVTVDGGVVTLRNLTLYHSGIILNGGTVILENVHITDASGAITVQPTSPGTLVVKNSTIDAGTAVLIKPIGSSASVRFDHVTITGNSGGGIKIDTTYGGPATVDIVDSEISSNTGNGLNAVGGAGGPAIFNISRSVIAKNGVAGVQVNGATAAAMIDTTLLDSNTSGATSVVNGGHTLTYGNNRIVGTAGSGFTGSAPLQ